MTGHTNEVTVPHISPLALRLFSSVGLSPSDHRIIAWLAETALGLCCMRCGCRLIPRARFGTAPALPGVRYARKAVVSIRWG